MGSTLAMRLPLVILLLAVWNPNSLLATEKPNVLLLCVDDLRPELGCYGVDYIHSPHMDQLAESGRIFKRHSVQAPTCGASRYALLTGKYGPGDNNALFKRIEGVSSPTAPEWFRKAGYITVSVGKVSHHPGGLGGPDWNDDAIIEMPNAWVRHVQPVGKWLHPRGIMHGLADGEIRGNAKEMDVFQLAEGYDDIYPDGLTTETALQELNELAAANESKPFFLAVGIIRPHLPFGAPAKYMKHYEDAELPPIPHPKIPEGKSTFHKSGEFMKYNRWGRDPNEDAEFAAMVRKHYAACAGELLGAFDAPVTAIGCHGQTLRHFPDDPCPISIQMVNGAALALATGQRTTLKDWPAAPSPLGWAAVARGFELKRRKRG